MWKNSIGVIWKCEELLFVMLLYLFDVKKLPEIYKEEYAKKSVY